ncbi:MAG TPA: M56 family metallopeptidase [Candidatus Sulfotelmatobacter sp.]|nr:M56 family metallopeptidase [Candidatus Sulfotelmatobacter sp.]
MSEHVESLNLWGKNFWSFAWPMLWQSSLLIATVFAFDWLFARRIRASIRYALWVAVLVKLILPPSLALPTGATWWLWRAHPVAESPVINNYTVSFGDTPIPDAVLPPPTIPVAPPPPTLSNDGWVLLAVFLAGVGWISWLAFRWVRVAGKVHRAATAPAELNSFLDEVRQLAGLRGRSRLKLIDDTQSPAVYGLFRPVILLPRTLANQLSSRQLRTVLLHEAVHLRRGDVWVNCAQTFLQIAYWWHPLLWLANARIRRLREEAVDDAVMLALRDGSDAYASTLLEVARFAFRRPLASLGLIGILESRSALRQRVERLVNFRPPRKAGITLLSAIGIFAFCAVALPMGQGPDEKSTPAITESGTNTANETSTNTPANLSVNTQQKTNDLEVSPFLGNSPTTKEKSKIIVIAIDANAHMFLNDEPVTMPLLRERLEAIKTRDPNPMVLIRAASKVDYQYVFSLLDTLRQLNIHKISWPDPADADPQRKALLDKLNSIHLDVSYKNEPLSQVLGDLHKQSGKEINFIFNPNIDPAVTDPATGFPMIEDTGSPDTSHQVADCSRINIKLTLKNATLQEVLNAICSASDRPIKYSIHDYGVVYGVVFSAKNTNAFYEVRTFKVNPNIFYSIQNIPSNEPPGTNPQDVGATATKLFTSLGVKLDPPKTVSYDDQRGILSVYATPQDLDLIENAIEVLSENPPKLHIKAHFIEVPQAFLSSTLANSMLKDGCILPNPELQIFLDASKFQNEFADAADPELTLPSGDQAKMSALRVVPVITGYGEASAGAISGSAEPYARYSDGTTFVPHVEQVQTGSKLNVTPTLLSDGYTIRLKVDASQTDFFGYANSRGLAPNVATNAAGKRVKLPTSLPAIQTGRATVDKFLYDGQTLVLFPSPDADLSYASDEKAKERISKTVEHAKRKNGKVEIFLATVSVVDAAGNRIHSDDEMPFAQTAIPPQLP